MATEPDIDSPHERLAKVLYGWGGMRLLHAFIEAAERDADGLVQLVHDLHEKYVVRGEPVPEEYKR